MHPGGLHIHQVARMNRLDTAELLARSRESDRASYDALYAHLCEPLHEAGRGQLRRHRYGGTLDASALDHEAHVRPLRERRVPWGPPAPCLGVAPRAMRRVIMDVDRRRTGRKRRG